MVSIEINNAGMSIRLYFISYIQKPLHPFLKPTTNSYKFWNPTINSAVSQPGAAKKPLTNRQLQPVTRRNVTNSTRLLNSQLPKLIYPT